MLRSLYIASTGMMSQRKKMDVVTNNIVNIDTTGYKKDVFASKSFKDMMIERLDDTYGTSVVGLQNTGIHIDDVTTQFEQGAFEQTGRETDVALGGEGFFVVDTADGIRYTRDGAFAISQDGYLVNGDGDYIQGTNGKIQVGSESFVIDDLGNVTVNDVKVSRLQVVTFADLTGLAKTGDNMFTSGAGSQQATEVVVKQGYLEASNVDMAEEMVNMVELTRAYQVNQRVVTMLDQSLSKTVNEVGRL